ncbi:Protein dpy-30 [Actinomortierella ambigua]|nr:Protein dpy-30 [Actinomortierella ambigua]
MESARPIKSIGDILNSDRESSAASPAPGQPRFTKSELEAMPVRSYLDQTVLRVLLEGLKQLAKDRPENPLEYLGHYLLDRSEQSDQQ